MNTPTLQKCMELLVDRITKNSPVPQELELLVEDLGTQFWIYQNYLPRIAISHRKQE